MYALGWKDRKGLMYVMNVGLTVASEPYKHPRSRKVLSEDGRRWVTCLSNREVACPEAIKTFYTYFGAVDHHDHLRQGTLAFHKHWPTKTWWHRVYSNVIAICIVDAYHMQKQYISGLIGEAIEPPLSLNFWTNWPISSLRMRWGSDGSAR
jgi:hypothetical protein